MNLYNSENNNIIIETNHLEKGARPWGVSSTTLRAVHPRWSWPSQLPLWKLPLAALANIMPYHILSWGHSWNKAWLNTSTSSWGLSWWGVQVPVLWPFNQQLSDFCPKSLGDFFYDWDFPCYPTIMRGQNEESLIIDCYILPVRISSHIWKNTKKKQQKELLL